MAVNQAINLTNFLAEVRLAFRILIIETKSNDDYTNFSNFEYVQGKMELFYD